MIRLMDLIEGVPPKPNVFCAWCDKPIRHNPDIPAGQVSHGICQGCAEKWTKDVGVDDD